MMEKTLELKIEMAKKSFFDRAAVHRAVDGACRRVLSKAGAFVRTRAQSMMLRHKVKKGFGVKSNVEDVSGVAPPGEPPYVHNGLLVKFLFFVYEPEHKSVIIGPVRLNAKPEPTPIPALLEYGGTASRSRYSDAFVERMKRSNPNFNLDNPVRICVYRPRPYMRPALAAEAPKFPFLFRGSVKPVAA